ncbi:helix-turn-helix domain-containing protein [Streptomyces wedmorensis]
MASGLGRGRPGGSAVQGAGRQLVPERGAGAGTGRSSACGAGGVRLGGPALDAGPGRGADRGAVPGPYEISGVWRLLDRLGWSWQVPKVRAVERNEEAIAAWRTETWPAASHPRRSPRVEGGCASRTRRAPG